MGEDPSWVLSGTLPCMFRILLLTLLVYKLATGGFVVAGVLLFVVAPIVVFGRLFSNAYTVTVNSLIAQARGYAQRFRKREGFLPYDP